MDKQEVLRKLNNYSYYSARLEEIKDQIASMCYKTTATYGNLAAGTSNSISSKVEDYGNRRYELHKKELAIKQKLAEVKRLIECSGLNTREKELLWWIAHNGKLQAYARVNRIGKDNVYKIRDRAINKIIAANETQNVV